MFNFTEFSSPFTKDKSKKDKKGDLFIDDNAIPCEKKSKLRLFRTPSLPYRLKFRSHPVSDITPSKKNSKDSASSSVASTSTPAAQNDLFPAFTPVPSAFRKSERNLLEKKSRDVKYIEKLKTDIESLNKNISNLHHQNAEKESEINELTGEIENMKLAEDFLKDIAEQAINKINQSDQKVKEILQNYDFLLHHMDRMNCENENLLELNKNLTESNDEFTKINEGRINELEKLLDLKNGELAKLKQKLNEKSKLMKNLEFELGKKTMENLNLTKKIENSEEQVKIFEVQHEENMKMMKNSYENEIFFLYSKLSTAQNQVTKLTRNQKKIQTMDLETQLDLENQKAQLEMEKKNINITIKNYQNIIEVLSLRLKNSDTDVENVMKENQNLKSEIANLKENYENLRNSAEELRKTSGNKDALMEQIMASSESEMVQMVSKISEYFNEKFNEIEEIKKSYESRNENLKKMSASLLEEYTVGINMARLELDDKQKKIDQFESEMKDIKLENFQLKMQLNEKKTDESLPRVQGEVLKQDTNDSQKEENLQLKSKVTNP